MAREFFLRTFAELGKAAVSFVMSVRSTACNNLTPTGRVLMKFDIYAFFFFRKYV
jgi:hypothetical protein